MGQPKFDVIEQLAVSLLKRNSLKDLCWDIADAIGSLAGFEDSVVYLRKDDALVQVAAFGLKVGPERSINSPLRIPLGQGIVGTVAQTGVPELIGDTSKDSRYIADCYDGRSELTVPVVYQDRVIAVLDSEHAQVNAYQTEHLEILQAMAYVCASRIASAIEEEENRLVRSQLAELNADLETRVAQRTCELAAAHERSLKERDRLQTVIDSLQEGLIALSSSHLIEFVSPVAARLLGASASELVGRAISEVFRVEGVTIPDGLASIQWAGKSEEATLMCSSGQSREIRWSVSPFESVDGCKGGCVIAFQDVTEEKAMAQRAELLDRMQSLGILAGGIAHDFNNNLAAILTSIDCLSGGNKSEEKAVDVARKACRAASQLTEQLMTYAKGGEPVRKPTDIVQVLRTAAALATSGSRVKVDLDLEKDLPATMLDSGQMIQVFSNIILNAVQAMPDGGRILVSARMADDIGIQVTVVDQGAGFASEAISRVFEPYFSEKKQGTGLGLTTCFFITKNHGGTIEVSNRPSGGGQVTVTLPAPECSGVAVHPRSSPDKTSPLTILLMDDEELVRDGLGMLIRTIGHEVISTGDGQQAMDAARTHPSIIDVALLDLTVRDGLGGEQIVSRLKELIPAIKCVAMSGYSESPAMARPDEFGFDGVIRKPFSRSELCSLLHSVAPLTSRASEIEGSCH